MSASCLVNREEVLGLLDELRSMLPEQLEQADVLLSDRDAVVEEGREAAKRLLDQARAEHDRLVEEQSVVIGARERAAIVITEANSESTRLLADADDYVDRKLAEFEIALDKLTQQVQRGRARLGDRRAADLGRLASDDPGAVSDPADSAHSADPVHAAPSAAPAHAAVDAGAPVAAAGEERWPPELPPDAAQQHESGLGDDRPLG
jgi:cell division septum initiation protein DivIVA